MLRQATLTLVVVLSCFFSISAQPVLTPVNVALGGGGSTYITDYNANFYNPANLFISDRIRNIDVGLLVTGTYFNGVQNFSGISEQRSNLENYIYAYKPGEYSINSVDRGHILEDNYIRNRSTSLHQTRLDATLMGFKIRNDKRALSFAVRNRIASSFEVGKGWYSNELQDINAEQVLDRTLIHRYQSMYEFSIGYAESFRFFSDMTSSLDELSIGAAPKFIIAGAYQNAVWKNSYRTNPGGSFMQVQSFEYTGTRNFANAVSAYQNGVSAQNAITSNITDEIFDNQGYGVGLDIGFTYLITLGSDLSTLLSTGQRTQKSLRLAFSITDIGAVRYPADVYQQSYASEAIITELPTEVSDQVFVGAPGQFLSFVEANTDEQEDPFQNNDASTGSKYVMLPTAIHSGILFEVNRLKLMGDLSIGLTNNAYNSTKLIASAGIELRPLKFLPLRAGTQLATELPSFFSFGTAIETKIWDISIATQFVSRTFKENPTLSGATIATLQFHF